MRSQVLAVLLVIFLASNVGGGISAGVMSERTAMKTSPMVPAFGFYFLSVGDASCSLSTGVCTVAIANEGSNSSYDLALAANYCNMDLISAKNSTTTVYTLSNGTAGGQIMNGLPHLTNEIATCTVPTSKLGYESDGANANSIFTLKLVNSLGSIPAGASARVDSSGVWNKSLAMNTSTTVSTVSFTTTNLFTYTTTLISERTTETTVTTLVSTSITAYDFSTVALGGLLAVALAALLLSRRKPS